MKKPLLLLLPLIFSLAGCTRDTARAFGDSLFSSRSEPTFRINAIRPVFNCADVPDPRYPCAGIGPEGFMRDLVVKPFANRHHIDIYSHKARAGNRVRLTWFSMQGCCDIGESSFIQDAKPNTAAFPYYIENTNGRITIPTSHDPRDNKSIAPIYRLGDCETAIDIYAGQPVRARLELWAPSKFKGGDLTIPVVPSENGKFRTGCREEKRNNLTWQVCSTAAKTSIFNRKTRQNIPIDRQREIWTTQLGKSGFFLRLTVTYSDPIFQYPGWYAERQANISEVIDTITLETLPYPPVVPQPDMTQP